MKVLFLDIDGVVNCVRTKTRYLGCIGIDPRMAGIVRGIVESARLKGGALVFVA
jgi:hypothetical protein